MIGINHHNFLSQRKVTNSLIVSSLLIRVSNTVVYYPVHQTHSQYFDYAQY